MSIIQTKINDRKIFLDALDVRCLLLIIVTTIATFSPTLHWILGTSGSPDQGEYRDKNSDEYKNRYEQKIA